MKRSLIVQMKLGNRWYDAAALDFGRDLATVQITYEVDHVFSSEPEVLALPETMRALSLRWPLDLAPRRMDHWPALLDDIGPGGAARRWWLGHLGLGHLNEREQRFVLLRDATIAPVGHLRIKESVTPLEAVEEPRLFPIESVLERDHDFLNHPQLQGASVGGATGAGGEAPKILLRVRGDEVWIDAHQTGDREGTHVLVKFPRRTRHRSGSAAKATERDRLILESEAVYYRALNALGVSTVDVSGMALHHNSRGQPSLWMPRFDVRYDESGQEVRLGLESLYALTDTPPGSRGDHQHYLNMLHRCLIEGRFLEDGVDGGPYERGPSSTELVVEYIKRDLLNVIFGNSDNHGRNTSVLKTPAGLWLAPIYDFAPMVMDPEGVVRSTRWPRPLEGFSGLDWRAICQAQAHLTDPEEIWEALRGFATRLRDLDERLDGLGLPQETLEFPTVGLRNINDRLHRWDLLDEGGA